MGDLPKRRSGMPEDVARLLKRHRIAAGLSQDDLAKLSGVSSDAISMLERGARRAPYQATLDLLAGALALDEDTRLEFDEVARLARSRRPRRQKHDLSIAELFPNNFAPQVTSFVGRDRDVAEIKELLRSHPLVTLVGTGGVGKTRCATQVGAQTLEDYPDGAWLVELASISDASLLCNVIAETLSVQVSRNRPALDAMLAYLKRKRLLLLLDNCEHVVDEARSVVAAILRACPRVSVLATSREPLRVHGEQVFRVTSLDLPPASEDLTVDRLRDIGSVQLFVDRARSAKSDFEFSADNACYIAEICRRLDGIPLALELAAPWVTTLSPKQLAQKLDERFRLLASADPSALPRHRTVRALIDWSYDLLCDRERRVFRNLSIFAGDFTLELAASVCSDESFDATSVLEKLGSLVNKSLVQACPHESSTRYRLLETTREYARERIAGTMEYDRAARDHATAFLALAEDLERRWATTPDRPLLDEATLDLENFRAALSWALGARGDVLLGQRLAAVLRPVWGYLAAAEGRQWVKLARERAADETPASVVAALDLTEAWLAATLSQYKASHIAAERALARYRVVTDPIKAAYAQELLGTAMVKLGRATEGEGLLTQALAEARRLGAKRLSAFALQGLAFARRVAGDPDAEVPLQAEALAIYRAIGADRAAADVIVNSAEREFRGGDSKAALALASEALGTYRAFGMTRLVAMVLSNITAYLLSLERYDEAHLAGTQALAAALDAQYDVAIAFALQRLAATMALKSEVDASEHRGDLLNAGLLLGYVDTRLQALEVPREYSEEQERTKMLASLHRALGEERTARLIAEGSIWDEEKAVGEAMLV